MDTKGIFSKSINERTPDKTTKALNIFFVFSPNLTAVVILSILLSSALCEISWISWAIIFNMKISVTKPGICRIYSALRKGRSRNRVKTIALHKVDVMGFPSR